MRPMRVLLAWGVAFINAIHYVLFKLRLMNPPDFRRYPTHWEPWLGGMLGWNRTLRLRHAERCPVDGPAVFVSNHVKLDDPLFLWGAVDRATGGRRHIYFMMRDDFFRGWPWDYLPFSMNELTACSGCIQISRDQVSLSQLKPLLQVLEAGESFLMFPGRTRSRTGQCIEYRDGIDEPGGVSFFLAHGSRRAGRDIPAVPLARTHNPVSGVSTIVFGQPMLLPKGACREAQRNFDLDLAVAISNLIELHALHALSMLLYLRCLHGQPGPYSLRQAQSDVWAILKKAENSGRFVDGGALEEPMAAVAKAARWLEKHGALRLLDDSIHAEPSAILSAPEWDTRYRKRNPAKFYTNQALHLGDVVAAAEERVLCQFESAYSGT